MNKEQNNMNSLENEIGNILVDCEGHSQKDLVKELQAFITTHEQQARREGVKEFKDGLVDQLKTGTIVDQYDADTDLLAEEKDTALVSAVLHTTAIQIIEMFYEDFTTEHKGDN